MGLTKGQRERYARNVALKEINQEGQRKLLQSRVLVIGAGGLGSPAILYLAAAGVGTIGIVDGDAVDLSNLQRQILHGTQDIGVEKVRSARRAALNIDPDICVHTYHTAISEGNIMDMITDYDFVVDATDNFEAKFLINDACVLAEKPFVHAGVIRFQGQLMTYVPGCGPCYRCIFKNPPPETAVPSAQEEGVIGAVCGIIGSMQALEAIKYLTGVGQLLTGYLLTCDALTMELRKVKLPKRTLDCAVCGEDPKITKIGAFEKK